jgi:hypothetical protein
MGALKPLIMKGPPFSFCSQYPREVLNRMWWHLTRLQAYETALQEYDELEFRTTPSDLDALGPFPAVPLVVLVHDPEAMIDYFVKRAGLTRADGERVEALWGTLLADHASLSPLGRVESVAGSGHLIHLEKPDVSVVRIADVIRRHQDAWVCSLKTLVTVAAAAQVADVA